ncbi:MAG: hypothetical protein AAB361_01630 [Patescibacteria group bacterium]|mgnify:FL=1
MSKVWYTISYNTNARSPDHISEWGVDVGLQLVHVDTKEKAERLMSLVVSEWENFYVFSNLYGPFDSVEEAREDYEKKVNRTASAFCRPDVRLWKR